MINVELKTFSYTNRNSTSHRYTWLDICLFVRSASFVLIKLYYIYYSTGCFFSLSSVIHKHLSTSMNLMLHCHFFQPHALFMCLPNIVTQSRYKAYKCLSFIHLIFFLGFLKIPNHPFCCSLRIYIAKKMGGPLLYVL